MSFSTYSLIRWPSGRLSRQRYGVLCCRQYWGQRLSPSLLASSDAHLLRKADASAH